MVHLRAYKKILATLLGIFLLFIVVTPVFAQVGPQTPDSGLVLCAKGQNGDPNECNFEKLYETISKIWRFLLIDIMVPVAIVALVFAGFKYVSAQGNPGEVKKAHDIFYYVVIGMLVAFSAWLVVYTILDSLKAEVNFLEKPATKK